MSARGVSWGAQGGQLALRHPQLQVGRVIEFCATVSGLGDKRGCSSELDERAAEARYTHLGRLLACAHGYLVRSLRAEPLGRLAALSYGADARWPAALTVRPRDLRGLWSRTTRELPVSAVLAVISARREVRVMTDGWPPGGVAPEGFSGAFAEVDAPARRAPHARGSPARAAGDGASSSAVR
jgi:hypothetical protein